MLYLYQNGQYQNIPLHFQEWYQIKVPLHQTLVLILMVHHGLELLIVDKNKEEVRRKKEKESCCGWLKNNGFWEVELGYDWRPWWPGKTRLMWSMKKRKNVFYLGHLEIRNRRAGYRIYFKNNKLWTCPFESENIRTWWDILNSDKTLIWKIQMERNGRIFEEKMSVIYEIRFWVFGFIMSDYFVESKDIPKIEWLVLLLKFSW